MPKNTKKLKKAVPAKTTKKKTVSAAKKPAVKKATPKKAALVKKSAPAKAKNKAAKKPAVKAAKSAAPAKKSVVEEAPLKKGVFKKEVVKTLIEARGRILQEVAQKVKSESDITKHEIGDIYDIASNERERELNLTFGDRDREKLSEIEDALVRIKDGSYGTCEECAEPIAEKRLRAMPFTRVCVECQSKTEREQRIKGRFEEETGLGIMERTENEEEEF